MRRSRCVLRKIHSDNDVNDEEFQSVIVEPSLKLRDDEAPEAALPVARAAGVARLADWVEFQAHGLPPIVKFGPNFWRLAAVD